VRSGTVPAQMREASESDGENRPGAGSRILRCGERVGSAGIGLHHLEIRAKQPAQAPHHAAEQLLVLSVRRSGQREKARAFPVAEYASGITR